MDKHSETSEKSIERYLCRRAKELGGMALKYYNPISTGWPDRLVMLPQGHAFWVELKSKGKLPTSLQCVRLETLRDMGFSAYVCDSKDRVDEILNTEMKAIAAINRFKQESRSYRAAYAKRSKREP